MQILWSGIQNSILQPHLLLYFFLFQSFYLLPTVFSNPLTSRPWFKLFKLLEIVYFSHHISVHFQASSQLSPFPRHVSSSFSGNPFLSYPEVSTALCWNPCSSTSFAIEDLWMCWSQPLEYTGG